MARTLRLALIAALTSSAACAGGGGGGSYNRYRWARSMAIMSAGLAHTANNIQVPQHDFRVHPVFCNGGMCTVY